jgi:hypothetical protein
MQADLFSSILLNQSFRRLRGVPPGGPIAQHPARAVKKSTLLSKVLDRLAARYDLLHDWQRRRKVVERNVCDVLSSAIHSEIVLSVRLILHEENVCMFGSRNVWKNTQWGLDKVCVRKKKKRNRPFWVGMTLLPDTPSPKKKSIGGLFSLRYGRIACDLSCPNPLFALKTISIHKFP